MIFNASRSILLTGLIAAGVWGFSQPTHAQVAVDITGTHGLSETGCTKINSLFFGWDCTYGGTNSVGGSLGWTGPSIGGSYYTAGSIGDSILYVPIPGDGKISPAITGQLTITGTGASATVGGTIVVGAAVRNISTGQTTRAVQGWTSITHTLAATPVTTAVANGASGFDYVIGSLGAPAQICVAPGGACFGLHETGADTTLGPVDFWGVGGVGGTKPAVGITKMVSVAGAAATGTTDQTNVGASTTGVIAGGTCASTDATAPLDCDASALLWGTPGAGLEDPGFDNLIVAFSTNAAGDITSGRAYWTQDYRINLGGGSGDNSDAAGTFTFTGTAAGAAPVCADFAASVLEDSINNAIAAPAQCTNFGAAVTITIVTPPVNGTASVSGANNIVYTPNPGFDGTDTVTYNGSDGTDNDDGVLTITVAANQLPVAPDGTITISTQGVAPNTVTGTLDVATLPGYSAGNAPTTVTVAQPANGTTSVAGTVVSYTPAVNTFVGSEPFVYTLVDSDGDTVQGTVTATAANVLPTISNASIVTDQNEVSAPLALTFTPGNGSLAQHTLAVTTQGTDGSCAISGTNVTYTPDADFFGTDSCVVTLTDGNGDSANATISVTVDETSGIIVIDGGSSAVDPASLLALGGLVPLLRRRRKAAAKLAAKVAMVAAAGVLAAPAAMAADDRWDWNYDGLYLGLGAIGTSLETSDSFNSSLIEELDLLGVESSGNFEDFPYGGQLYVGWMFNNNFGLEGRWSDSGDGESDILSVDSNGNRTNIGDIEASIDGWTIYGVANWPVAQRWDLFGKVGYTDQSADVDVDGGEGGSASLSDDDSGLAAALGARWRFARHWAATIEGEYLGVDFDDTLDEPWRASANVEYWFGGSEIAPPAAAPARVVAAPPPPPPVAAAPKDSDGDGVLDGTDQCPETPRGDRVGPAGCSCDVTRQLQFAFGSADLTDADKLILDEMAETMTRLKFVSGTIEGHTDSVGPEAYNQGLSERRAQTVADYLQSKGIAGDRLQVVGRGEGDPIADNKTAEGRAQNRRVVAKRTDCDK